MKRLLIIFIRLYQNSWSLMAPASCRFHPSCSAYQIELLQIYPVPIALYLGFRRILKCHPFHQGGIDLVKR